jgi:hypothetical protein
LRREKTYKHYAKWWTVKRESEEVIVPMIIMTTQHDIGKDLYFVHVPEGGKSE